MKKSNRRDFMKGSLMATAAMAASAVTGATGSAIAADANAVPVSSRLKTGGTKAAGEPPMRLSVLSYSFRGLMEQGKYAHYAHDHGFMVGAENH